MNWKAVVQPLRNEEDCLEGCSHVALLSRIISNKDSGH
jgi:hypothetical protein